MFEVAVIVLVRLWMHHNREVDARYESDTWTVTIDGGEVYEVPLAAIEGG